MSVQIEFLKRCKALGLHNSNLPAWLDEIESLHAQVAELKAENDKYSQTCERYKELYFQKDTENIELKRQRDEYKADANRIDFIQSNARCDPMMDGNHKWWPTNFNKCLTGPSLREAIDAAKGGGDDT